jgi:hypothetical protein
MRSFGLEVAVRNSASGVANIGQRVAASINLMRTVEVFAYMVLPNVPAENIESEAANFGQSSQLFFHSFETF